MTESFGWTFPSALNGKCEEKGLNDSGIETFRGDTIVSLAREICQNSLDSPVKPSDGSATVNFDGNFRALSKRVSFQPCAPAQGKEGLGE